MKNKKLKLGMFFIVGVLLLLVPLISGVYMRSSTQYTQPGFSSGLSGGYWRPDSSMCEAGQDFIIQIAPFGCTPAVVRSDLLEEQNVPVFCQLAATKINPLIKVEAIESISFTGKRPKEVQDIGFHPVRAALGVEGDLNSPIFNNIGYVVIVLKKQKNESVMPDFVEGTLTAKIKYDIKNAFGIGKASFYLPEIIDEDWDNDKKIQYSFWNGRFYLRAGGIDEQGARILVYDDIRKLASVDLEKGKTSREIYLPGFDCLAGLQLRLDGLESPDTRARLNINGEIVEVADEEKFLESRCQIKDINKKGLVQEVTIRCKEDENSGLFGSKSFELKISPKVKLSIGGVEGEYEVGEKVPIIDESDKNKNVYLGFIGTKGDTGKRDDLYVRFVQTPYHGERLTDNMLSEVARYDGGGWGQEGGLVKRIASFIGEASTKLVERFARYLVQGSEISGTLEFSKTDDVYGTQVSIIGFAEPQDEELKEDTKENYQNAIKDYDEIVSKYSSEKFQDEFSEISFGEQALYQKILLAEKTKQLKTMFELCKEFERKYPDSKENLKTQCDSEYKLSSYEIASRDVLINGRVKRIFFDGIYEPSEEEYSAEIIISNVEEDYSGKSVLQKNEEAYFSDTEFIKLKELHEDYALFDVSSVKESEGRELFWKTNNLKIELDDHQVIGENNYQIRLININLKKSAKVSVIPSINNVGTEANVSFKIGIEKRLIQLSPEKTREKIASLSKKIADWEEKSEQLGNVIKGLKTACLGVGFYLTIKNFFTNTGGKAIARQEVMKDIWYPRCSDAVSTGKIGDRTVDYKTINECLTKEADNIDKDVDGLSEVIEEQNEDIKRWGKLSGETKDWLGQRTYNDEEFMKIYSPKVQKCLEDNLGASLQNPNKKDESINIANMINTLSYGNWKENSYYSKEQFRDVERYCRVIAKGDSVSKELRLTAEKGLYSELSDIEQTSNNYANRNNLASDLGISANQVGFLEVGWDVKKLPYDGLTYKDVKNKVPIDINPNTPLKILQTSTGENYIMILDDSAGTNMLPIKKDKDNNLMVYNSAGTLIGEDKIPYEVNNVYFQKYDETTYRNSYKFSRGESTPCLRYYETEPYRGLPAIVPFDLEYGWYAYVGQNLPIFGNIASYDKSGRVTSFWVCNVGENGIEENRGGDDICQMINTGTGQAYDQFAGLGKSEASKIIRDANEAVERVSRYKPKISEYVDISKKARRVKVCKPAVDIPEMECQSFMSPKDCQLLFNVCDPVICPSSRCNFGGSYHVKDVIQSGIIGSIVLCLPNIREGIYIPVCLTGIKAGIDGLLSVYISYRDCLQESLDTGKMVGICDEIYSIHLCEFFWRQSLPLAQIIIPKMMEIAMGQNVRGGGEYLGVASAWDNAGRSMDYFVQYYAATSYEAFKARIVEGVGEVVCKGFVSVSYPDGGNILDSLTEPDSPPQFHGWLHEIPFTSTTVPPISHYKVYYHIYAGKESRAYYKVYLKIPPGSSFYQDASSIRHVDSGYIPTGGYASETRDFTAPSGYNQLCIMVNNQEECGFKQVSTSYAINYVEDKYMEEQASEKDIKTEKECIAGSVSAYSLLTPSIQAAAEEMIAPEIYKRGIIRICASDNPGKGTDSSRWTEVGYCDNQKIKCWLDRESVKNVIEHKDIEEGVLEEHTKTQLEILQSEGGYFTEDKVKNDISEVKELIKESKFEEVIEKIINEFIDKVFWNSKKAELLYLRAQAYGGLAGKIESVEDKKKSAAPTTTPVSEKDDGEKEDEKEGEVILPSPTKVESRFSDKDFLNRLSQYDNIISEYSIEYDVPENLIKAIITQESYATEDATDKKGSFGLMQVSEGAAEDVGLSNKFKNNLWIVPNNNINIGTAYYVYLRDKYYKNSNSGEDLKKITLAAYNWGLGNINKNCEDKKWENCKNIPQVVLQYISNILAYENEFKKLEDSHGAITDSNQDSSNGAITDQNQN